MAIKEKIQNATEYVAKFKGTMDATVIQNDAANIFADNYEDYMAIWRALQEG